MEGNSGKSADCIRIFLDFQRIQTYLFAVPRLKAMLGANAMLGTLIRKELVDLAIRYRCNHRLPSSSLDLPGFDPSDPLENALEIRNEAPFDSSSKIASQEWLRLRDDPRALRPLGILCRDAGHFIADIDNQKLEEFVLEVQKKLLGFPGLLVKWSELKEPASGKENDGEERQDFDINRHPELGSSNPMLPVLEICADTGRDPAAESDPDSGIKDRFVSNRVLDLEKSADRFYGSESFDLINCLAPVLPGYDKKSMRMPADLDDLAGYSAGYLALISLDGNNIGNRFKKWRTLCQTAGKNSDSEIFFHPMRVAMRRATVAALGTIFDETNRKAAKINRDVVIPYQLLMFGGDDLLMLCQPQYALDFIVELEKELSRIPLSDEKRMSFGAGVTIAKASLPFHRLIEAAESLQSSAKFLWRSQAKDEKGEIPEQSTVDWEVTTAGWFDDPIEERKRFAIRRYEAANGQAETLCLTKDRCL